MSSFLVQRRLPFGWVLQILTLGVILVGGGAIGTIVAELLGACNDLLSRNRRREEQAAMHEVIVP